MVYFPRISHDMAPGDYKVRFEQFQAGSMALTGCPSTFCYLKVKHDLGTQKYASFDFGQGFRWSMAQSLSPAPT